MLPDPLTSDHTGNRPRASQEVQATVNETCIPYGPGIVKQKTRDHYILTPHGNVFADALSVGTTQLR